MNEQVWSKQILQGFIQTMSQLIVNWIRVSNW
jgi:hypothetical protein